jgi:hypothetical protein
MQELTSKNASDIGPAGGLVQKGERGNVFILEAQMDVSAFVHP